MCRLLAYLGSPVSLEHLLYKPEHSLIVQSYQPREMTSGVVNA
ncbi:MAG: ergothioneine biosynthesis protein EgtC, partial [Nostoc sp.]